MKFRDNPIVKCLCAVLKKIRKCLKSLRAHLSRRLGKMRGAAAMRGKRLCVKVRRKLRSFVAWLKKMHAGFNIRWARANRHLGKMWVRLVVLFITLILGAVLGKCISPWVLCFLPERVFGDIRTVVGAAHFTLPTFLALWWFRTYDSIKRDLRDNFEAGVNHIASDTPIRIEIGAEILANVSKLTSAYNREITITFIKRLKRSPADAKKNKEIFYSDYRWGYAQHMLKWLKDHQRKNKKYDLNLLDLRYQEFTSATAEITICEVLEMHDDDDLTVDVAGCNDDLDNFFGDCDRAYKQVDAAKKKHLAMQQGLYQGTLPRHRELRTIVVTVSRGDCQEDPFANDFIDDF